MTPLPNRPGEFEIIARYFAPLAGEGSFNLKDDAALVDVPEGRQLVVTQDAIAESVHFFPDDSPSLVARKALRVNLSDLAAKGATPYAFSLSLGLGQDWDETWVERFASGLRQDCEKFEISLIGGDTFSTDRGFVISITALGHVETKNYVSRLGAKPGDNLYVTGTIGDGALGLLARQELLDLSHADLAALTTRYLLPEPRIEAIDLVRDHASASIDVSDGLLADAAKLAFASDCKIEIDLSNVPFSAVCQKAIGREPRYLQTAVTGGDDYELLLAIPEDLSPAWDARVDKLSFSVTRIGKVVKGEGATFVDRNGAEISFDKTGYDHLSQGT